MFSQFLAIAPNYVPCQAFPVRLDDPSECLPPETTASICLVANSDLGTDWQSLSRWLTTVGYDVTVLDIGRDATALVTTEHAYHRLAGQYQDKFWYLPIRSLLAYHWLRQQAFTHVIFYQDIGCGYYATIAQRLGIALQDVCLMGWVSMPLAPRLYQRQQFPNGRTEIEQDFIERTTIAHYGRVVVDGPDTLRGLQETGFSLPSQSVVMVPNAPTSLGAWLRTSDQPINAATQAFASQNIIISVLLATYNRPDRLRRAIASLECQTVDNFELIVVDDGSTNPEVAALKQQMAALFAARGWRWVEQANTGPAKARNRVLELGRGSHIMFMDDDNLALPGEIACFTQAAACGADILTCLPGLQDGSDVVVSPIGCIPSLADPSGEHHWAAWAPVGACLPLALFTNPFGDTNSLFRREVFAALGGFQGDRTMAFEDFELLTRAVIGGYRLEVIPEILFMYLRHWGSRSIGPTIFHSHLESLRPLAALVPPWLRSALLVPRAEWYNQTLKLQSRKDSG